MPQSDRRPKVLFISQQRTSFVNDDLMMLSERYDVRAFQFGDASGGTQRQFSTLAYHALKQFFWLLRELPDAVFVFGWFADFHLALPVFLGKLMRKPVVVVLGGFDANVVPNLDYGVYGSSWRAPLARYVIRNASLLLPVSETLMYHENQYAAPPEVLKNGVRFHVTGLQTPHVTIPTGYDPEAWPMGPPERVPIVCTVAYLGRDRTVRVKGIDLLIEAARLMPDVVFQIVGVMPEFEPHVRSEYTPRENVQLLPPQSRVDLQEVYARASVYAQLSRTEGMPNVLAEAMCCGCIPVGSHVAGIPDVIGDAGLLVETPDPDAIAQAIRTALTPGHFSREHARQRIVQHFSKEQRRRKLSQVLDDVVQRGGATAFTTDD